MRAPEEAPTIEYDARRYEIRVDGVPVKLERRPMELLMLLVQHPGELVTRQMIAAQLWGGEVFVEIDQAINTAVRKVRQALDDDAEQPSYVQTVVGKGYRFIGHVSQTSEREPPSQAEALESSGCCLQWQGRVMRLRDGENIIGRDADCEVRIDSRTVSRRHASVVVDENAVVVADLGSKNGTRVNGQPVDAPTRLTDGDVIQIGDAILVCRIAARGGSTLTIAPAT